MRFVSRINTDFKSDMDKYNEFMSHCNRLPYATMTNIQSGDILIYSFFDDYHTFCRRAAKKYFFFRLADEETFKSLPEYRKYEYESDFELFLNITNIESFSPFQFASFSFYSSRVFRVIPKEEFKFFSQYAMNPEVFGHPVSSGPSKPSIFL